MTKDQQTDSITKEQLYLLSALVAKDEDLDSLSAFLTEQGAEIKKTENLGVKSLSFAVNNHRNLTLVSAFFTADPTATAAIDTQLPHEEYVERYLLTTWKAPLDKEPSHKAERKEASSKKASANV